MKSKSITRCMIFVLALILMSAGEAFAGVGGSDVPTVPVHVEVGATGDVFSFTITNQSTTPNDVAPHDMLLTGFFFTTACGSSLTPAIACPAGAQENGVIAINPLTATG